MNKIFFGLVFLTFSFSLTVSETTKIEVVPDFVGYILIYIGASELMEYSERFTRLKPYVIFMTVFSVISFAADIFYPSMTMGFPIGLMLGLLNFILHAFITYSIICGVKDIEVNTDCDLDTIRLYSVWKVSVILSAFAYLLFFIPMLAVFTSVINVVIWVCFLFRFHRTKSLFYVNKATDE